MNPSEPPSVDPTLGTTAASPPAHRRRAGSTVVAVAVLAVVAGTALFGTGYVIGNRTATQPGTPAEDNGAFQAFWDTYAAITEHYAGEPVPPKQVIDGAIKGMLESLGDPFSFYMTPEQFKASLEGLSGTFEGIGATITSRKSDGTDGCTPLGPDCVLLVVKPTPGAPADKAGLKAGDRITKVDGVTVDGATVDDTLKKVRGPKGTVVTLTVLRSPSPTPIQIAITRDVIVEPEVESQVLGGGNVGYLKLSGFSDNATAQFKAALEAHLDAKRTKLILDLRGNPGGYIQGAQAIASQFIGSGPIYWEKAANADPIPTEATPGGLATSTSIQLVVLVDGNTASASEILAGAIQDTARGQLVGSKTYGKGTVQEFLPLENDNGGFRLTIARWLTPKQRWINKTGLTPDVVVAAPASGAATGSDPVLDRGLQVLGAPSAMRSAALPVAA